MSAATPVEAALIYAERRGWPVFPCQWQGAGRKRPLIAGGFRDASTNRAQIERWWRRWPLALIGLATGQRSGVVVLDIDRKGGIEGFDTLDEIGAAILPVTPIVHTGSGGSHLYFRAPDDEIRNTAGARGRGLGVGLDIRGDGGYVIAPAPRSGYRWDPIWHIGNTPLAPLPSWATPRELMPEKTAPRRPVTGLSPYAEAALDGAVRRIIGARNGEQEASLNGEAFAIGTLAGAGGIPPDFARRVLMWAADQLISYDPRRPWRAGEARQKVERAFAAGLRSPRRATG
jgi:Bifunctional DNA primase/polymerase, N-terminal